MRNTLIFIFVYWVLLIVYDFKLFYWIVNDLYTPNIPPKYPKIHPKNFSAGCGSGAPPGKLKSKGGGYSQVPGN